MNLRIVRLALAMEVRLLARQWSTCALLGWFTLLFLYSVVNGTVNWNRIVEDGREAEKKASARIQTWENEVRSGKLATSGARGSKADTPYFASAQRLPYAIRPNPLLILQPTSLLSRSWVDELSAWSSAQDMFRHDDLASPLLLQSGSLDVNLLIIFVWPLVLCTMAMRGQAEDRSNEIHRWMQTLSGAGVSIQLGKLCAVLILGLLPVMVAVAGVAAHGGGPELAAWVASVAVYAGLWLGAFAWLARIQPAPISYLTRSITLWLIFAILVPAGRGLLLDRVAPAPDPSALVVARQGLDTRMGQLRGTAVEMVRRQQAAWFSTTPGDPRETSILSSFLIAEQELRRSYAPFEAALAARERWSRRLAWASPCLLFDDHLRAMSGDGDYSPARSAIAAHLQTLRSLLFPMILQGKKLRAEDYAGLRQTR